MTSSSKILHFASGLFLGGFLFFGLVLHFIELWRGTKIPYISLDLTELADSSPEEITIALF